MTSTSTNVAAAEVPLVDRLPLLRERRRPLDWIVGGALGLLVIWVIWIFATNPAMAWDVVATYLFDKQVLAGLGVTLGLTAVAMTIGLVIAVVLAAMRLSNVPVAQAVSFLVVWLFRSIPLLVLLILVYNVGLIFPSFAIGFPDQQPWLSGNIQDLITPFAAAVMAFALHESSYSSEIVRASILAVPKGQLEAADSLGMSPWTRARHVIFPQAMRVAIPPLANNVVGMVKGTAIVAFIAVPDLLYSVQRIYNANYEVIPLLLVATIWYLVIVTLLTIGQAMLERRFGQSARSYASRTKGSAK